MLWALYQTGGLEEVMPVKALGHEEPYRAAVDRAILCDDGRVSPIVCQRLAKLCAEEENVEVCCHWPVPPVGFLQATA